MGDGQEDDRQQEGADGRLKLDIKVILLLKLIVYVEVTFCLVLFVYGNTFYLLSVRDEFFDSLSCNTFDGKPKNESSKFSERKKLDAEVVCSHGRFLVWNFSIRVLVIDCVVDHGCLGFPS